MKKSSQNSKPEVSVIIVNYNTGKLLQKCVESVIKSCPECEVIVVDNNSSDGSLIGIQKLKFKNQKYNSKIKIVRNGTNPGFSKANNQAIKIAQGDYILLLNPDTEVKESAIHKLVEFAKSHADAGVICAKLILSDGTTQKSVFRFPTVWRAIQEFWFGANIYSSYVPQGRSPVAVDAVVGAAFLITPQALQKVGLLDERYFMYFEDLDYCRRVWNSGLKVYYLPTAEITHYHGVSGKNIKGEQWVRLIPSSKIYHGALNHYLINIVIKIGQKARKIIT